MYNSNSQNKSIMDELDLENYNKKHQTNRKSQY